MSKSKAGNFKPTGRFAIEIAKYNLRRAKAALKEGLKASDGDYEWSTAKVEIPELIEAIAKAHPGGSDDPNRLARDNIRKQTLKFLSWLKTGRGMFAANDFTITLYVP